jgi:regulator of cell morphogenesis and NO signaling
MTEHEIDSGMSVNDVIRRYPSTMAVFNRLGIDACCGGAASIDEAARRDGVAPSVLLAALREAAFCGAEAQR